MRKPKKVKEQPAEQLRLGIPYIVSTGFFAAVLGLIPPLLTRYLIDDAIPSGSMRAVFLGVGGMVGSALLAGILGVYQGYLNSLVGEGIMRDMRTRMVAHLHRMSLSFFTNTKTGEIMNRVSSDVDNVDNIVTGTFVTIVTNIAVMLTTPKSDGESSRATTSVQPHEMT